MTATPTPTPHATPYPATPLPPIALTLDELVAPLEIPADMRRATWAPKWAIILPIAIVAAFTLPAIPDEGSGLPGPASKRTA